MITAPFWAWFVGFLMENFGFAFTVLGFSCVIGITLMLFVKDTRAGTPSGWRPLGKGGGGAQGDKSMSLG